TALTTRVGQVRSSHHAHDWIRPNPRHSRSKGSDLFKRVPNKNPEQRLLGVHRSEVPDQRFRAFTLRSRDAACFRGAVAFFDAGFLADAAARFADSLAGAFAFTGADFFLAGLAATFAASAFGAFAIFTAVVVATAVTFSTFLAGAATFVVFNTSLPVTAAAACVAVTTIGVAAAFVLPFGRPPLRANCASANILRNASWASAMS